ncbi:MAG: 16S rRNA (cytosine(967)-C(5))-methyltransferase RsmB [Coprococcus sp.]|nr:16S rRNA (cytosine(967)-C(5))-methyltransferase RsmB [Coprococcus sp.]
MIKEISGRELALAVLLEMEQGEKSHIALRRVLEKYQYLDKRERAFATRLAEGTTERRIELDYVIDQFSKVKIRKMKPVIRCILRCAVYQMKYMESVPDSAACNEAVKLAVKKGFGNLRGFVNGVLRSIARNPDIRYPGNENFAEYLSVRWSVPEWIISMWLMDYGKERTKELLASLYIEKATTIRVNEERISREALKEKLRQEGATVKEHPLHSAALLISDYDYLGILPGFREGYFQVQDVSSIQAAERAGIREGDHVIDVCAAPGGKALHAAQLLKGSGYVEARDLTEEKVNLIWENIRRMGCSNIRAKRWDALVYDVDSEGKADVLLADLPCSGLGVMSKKTDIKYRVTNEQIKELVALQRRILETVHSYVRPGGTLVYSTCTVCRAENEENARWFTQKFPEYAMKYEEQIVPSETTDGFYIAVFKRMGEE